MKTKTFLLICLFFGIGLTRLNAQDYPTGPKNGITGTVVYDFVVPWEITIPITCDGTTVPDIISSPAGITIKVRDHWQKGVLIREISSINNIAFTSDITGEVFVQHGGLEKFVPVDFDPLEPPSEGFDYFHFNVKGNMGNHYIVHMVTDFSTWNVEFRANCH
jgi:hypothetical protein